MLFYNLLQLQQKQVFFLQDCIGKCIRRRWLRFQLCKKKHSMQSVVNKSCVNLWILFYVVTIITSYIKFISLIEKEEENFDALEKKSIKSNGIYCLK